MPAEFVLSFAGLGRAAIDEIFTEDCVFYEPKGVYHGRDEIDRVAGDPDKHSSWFFRPGRPK
jgi:hypothetical protein